MLNSRSCGGFWTMIILFCLWGLAQAGESFDNGVSVSSSRQGAPNFQADPFTGQFNYGIPIEVPPGRGGLAPQLSLQYSSATGNDWIGVGWSLAGLGYVERNGREGVPVRWTGQDADLQYDDAKGFRYVLDGDASELIFQTGGIYRPRINRSGVFFRFINPNRWEMTDRSGTKYYFGESASNRMENPTFPAGQKAGTFRWALNRIQDTNGNVTRINYFKELGYLYPETIEYNESVSAPAIPAQHRIRFILNHTTAEPRDDKSVNFRSGYSVYVSRRLRGIVVERVNDGGLIRKYNLLYGTSLSTWRSRLRNVEEIGNDGISELHRYSFSYSEQDFSFEAPVPFSQLDGGADENDRSWRSIQYRDGDDGGNHQWHMAEFLDIDGDGLRDRVLMRYPSAQPYFDAQYNSGSAFKLKRQWGAAIEHQGMPGESWNSLLYVTSGHDTKVGLWDMDGDGLLDRVSRRVSGDRFTWLVERNNGLGFDPSTPWGSIDAQGTEHNDYDTPFGGDDKNTRTVLADMNGDGLLDRVMADRSGAINQYKIQFNMGGGFSGLRKWIDVTDLGMASWHFPLRVDSKLTFVNSAVDINGDGLPDRILRRASAPFDHWIIQFNNGAGRFMSRDSGITSPMTGLDYESGVDESTWGCPSASELSDDNISVFADLLDMNGDGLPDRVLRKKDAPYDRYKVQINKGIKFGPLKDWMFGASVSVKGSGSIRSTDEDPEAGTHTFLADIDGDKLPDRIRRASGPFSYWLVERNKGPLPDLLITAENGIGAKVEVSYLPSTQFDNRDRDWSFGSGNPWQQGAKSLLPYAFYVVSQVSVSGGKALGDGTPNPPVIKTYDYRNGMFDPVEREFRGFRYVSVSDASGTQTRSYFHQGGGYDDAANGEFQDSVTGAFAKAGMPYRVDVVRVMDGVDYKYTRTLNKVALSQTHPGCWFPYTAQTIKQDFGGTSGELYYQASATRFEFDANLNLTKKSEYGRVTSINPATHGFSNSGAGIAGDEVFTHLTYATIPQNPDILDRPLRIWVSSDSAGSNVLRETLAEYYPNATGNLWRSKRWHDRSASYFTETYLYDAYGNVRSFTDPVGALTSTEYEAPARIYTSRITVFGEAANFVSETSYDPDSGNLLEGTDPKGLVTRHRYDKFHRRTITEVGKIPFAQNPADFVWKEKLLYENSLSAQGENVNRVRRYVQDGVDLVTGHESMIQYDGLGRVLCRMAEREGTEYPLTKWTYFLYDGNGRPRKITDPLEQEYTYPPADNLPGTITLYDYAGRTIRATPPVGDTGSPTGPQRISYGFGETSWQVTRIDPENKSRRETRDAYGRVTLVEELTSAGTYATALEYDSLGLLLQTTDHRGNLTENLYDSLGRKWWSSDPDMGVWQYEHDSTGRVLQQTDAEGNRTELDYDRLGRVKTKTLYPPQGAPEIVRYLYDQSDDGNYTVFPGQLYKVEDSQGWEKNGYDIRGRLLKTTRFVSLTGKAYTTEFSYNDGDNVVEIHYPNDAASIRNIYGSGGALLRVESLKPIAGRHEVFYEAQHFGMFGQVTQIQYGNGVRSDFSYYPNSHRLWLLRTLKPGVGSYQDLWYQYDRAGNIIDIHDNVYSGDANASLSNISYDDLHRLRSYDRNGETMRFDYDEIGNIKHSSEVGNFASEYHYQSANPKGQPHAVTSVGARQFAYDKNGNMIFRDGQVLGYDGNRRLVSIVDGPKRTSFGYAHDGRRLWKQAQDRVSLWIGEHYEEKEGKKLCHIFAGDRRVCTFEVPLMAIPPVLKSTDGESTRVFHYVHGNHLGSSNVLTDRDGNSVQHLEDAVFGAARMTEKKSGFQPTNRFTGQALDADLELYYFKSRYYDPMLGRFLQADTLVPDPFNPQSFNRYSYVLNNPLKYTDPSGHFVQALFVAVLKAALIGGAIQAGRAYLAGEDVWEGFVAGAKAGAISGAIGYFGEGFVGYLMEKGVSEEIARFAGGTAQTLLRGDDAMPGIKNFLGDQLINWAADSKGLRNGYLRSAATGAVRGAVRAWIHGGEVIDAMVSGAVQGAVAFKKSPIFDDRFELGELFGRNFFLVLTGKLQFKNGIVQLNVFAEASYDGDSIKLPDEELKELPTDYSHTWEIDLIDLSDFGVNGDSYSGGEYNYPASGGGIQFGGWFFGNRPAGSLGDRRRSPSPN